jgi:hypothetical protein
VLSRRIRQLGPAPNVPDRRLRRVRRARRLRIRTVCTAVLVAIATLSAASTSSGHTTDPRMPIIIAPATPVTAESTVSAPVTTPGSYLAVVTLRARARRERVTLYLTGAPRREVRASPWAATRVSYRLALTGGRVRARAVSDAPAVRLALALVRQQTVASGAPSSRAPAATTPPASTSTLSAAAPPPPAPIVPPPVTTPPVTTPPPPPPIAPDPYTNLKFDDEFSGPAGTPPSSQYWGSDVPGSGCGGGTLSTDTSSTANASVNGQGQLVISALPNGGGYTSAQLDTAGHYSFEYGSAQARILVPPGQGLCSAFWLLGDSTASSPCGWPGCGEIDALEAPSFGPVPVNAVFTLHGTIAGGQTQQFETSTNALGNLSAGWHTYGIIWRPGSITWTIDGVAYATATPSTLVPGSTWAYDNRPFHLLLDLAVGGWPGSPTGGAEFPAHLLVDWVRVYQ